MIRATELHKRYGLVRALDGLSLDVPAGAIYGFIGENGAGKTTTIRVLATLALPDEGDAEIGGISVLREPDEVRRLMGYMPDFFGVYDDLKVSEYLEFYASLTGMRGASAAAARNDLLDLVDLAEKRAELVENLSRGMQQRLCLARSLIHDPQVLLLDEPASGLDPVARVEMREILKELARMGKTILISSHILAELADLCSHIGIVDRGQIIRQGPLADVLWAAERPSYLLRTLGDAARVVEVLEQQEGVGPVTVASDGVRFHCDGGSAGSATALAAVVQAGIPVTRFIEEESSLEATFLHLLRGDD